MTRKQGQPELRSFSETPGEKGVSLNRAAAGYWWPPEERRFAPAEGVTRDPYVQKEVRARKRASERQVRGKGTS
jgi:hypothetical protein